MATIFTILLPDGKEVRMAIDNGTPMMDVLVHVATKNGITAGGKVLKVPTDRPPGYLHYKPNTPIGVLGCTTLEVVPKHSLVDDRPLCLMSKMSGLPFQPSLRVQVDLPQKRRTVLRVHPHMLLSEILRRACDEGHLGSSRRYELRGAKAGHGYPLKLGLRLVDVGTVDFVVAESQTVRKAQSEVLGSFNETGTYREKERKKGGCFRSLFNRRKKKTPKPSSNPVPEPLPLSQRLAVTNGNAWSSSTLTSFRTFPSSEYDIPSEPSPPPPRPPRLRNPEVKKRPAPPPPTAPLSLNVNEYQNTYHRTSVSSTGSGYRSTLLPSPSLSAMYEEVGGMQTDCRNPSVSDKSSLTYHYLSVTPSGSVRTAISSLAAPSHPESLRSEVQKKRKAPPPPSMAGESQRQTALSRSTLSLATVDGRRLSQDSRGLAVQPSQNNTGSTCSVSKRSCNEDVPEANAIASVRARSCINVNMQETPIQKSLAECNVRNVRTLPKSVSRSAILMEEKETAPAAADGGSVEKPLKLASSRSVSEVRKLFQLTPTSAEEKQLPRGHKKQPTVANATCQTDPSIGPSALGIKITLDSVCQESSLSPQSAIVCTEPKGDLYQTRTQIKCFEDEYYSKNDVNDYARTIQYGLPLLEAQAKEQDNGKLWHVPTADSNSDDSKEKHRPPRNLAHPTTNRSQERLDVAVRPARQKISATVKSAVNGEKECRPVSPKPPTQKKESSSSTLSRSVLEKESRSEGASSRDKAQDSLLTVRKRGPSRSESDGGDRKTGSDVSERKQPVTKGVQKTRGEKSNSSSADKPLIAAAPPAPPLPPTLPSVAAPPLPKENDKQRYVTASQLDGRADLMQAIRNFNSATMLKKTRRVK